MSSLKHLPEIRGLFAAGREYLLGKASLQQLNGLVRELGVLAKAGQLSPAVIALLDAGGLIGGLIVAAIINADVGKIAPGLAVQDPVFLNQLRGLEAHKVPVKEIQLSELPASANPAIPTSAK